ncbi:zinc metalloproteinase nas-14-like [Homarus americanus]|uniref:zinc metalloproteinase nas-14-like n=1 Tax=Homarus americanus TaxID=6706 RepID=UPI001C46D160|nr:zinc metalloproteinase nas-14-like [Homarus americanus]
MHYHPHAFALNPALPTLIPRVPGVIFSHHQGLSQTDIERVNRLYQCERVQPLPTTTSTPAPTPAPKPAPTPKPRPQECVDNHKLCWNWAQKGRCTSSAFVSTTCKKSCGTCPGRVVCVDKHKDCGWWAGRGECVKRPDYMSSRCRFSCGFCSA